MPKLLQFFSGNIGLHHVHHLNAKIPNYNLQRAHDETPMLHQVPVLTLRDGLRATQLKLWDESRATSPPSAKPTIAYNRNRPRRLDRPLRGRRWLSSPRHVDRLTSTPLTALAKTYRQQSSPASLPPYCWPRGWLISPRSPLDSVTQCRRLSDQPGRPLTVLC